MEEFILLKSISKDFTIWSDHIGISKASLSLLYGESVDLQCSPGTHIWCFYTPSLDFVIELTLKEGFNVSFKIIMEVEMPEGATIKDFNRIALGKTCTTWREFIHIPNQNLPIKRIMVKFGENCSRLQVGSSFASGKNQNSNLLSVQYQLVGKGCAVIYENSLSRGQKKLESEDYQDLFKEDLKILRKLLGNSILEHFEVDCETFQCSMQRRNLKNQFESFLKTITDIWGTQKIATKNLRMKFMNEDQAEKILSHTVPNALERISFLPMDVAGISSSGNRLGLSVLSELPQWKNAKFINLTNFLAKSSMGLILHFESVLVHWLFFESKHLRIAMEEFVSGGCLTKNFTILCEQIFTTIELNLETLGEAFHIGKRYTWYYHTKSPGHVVELTLVESQKISLRMIRREGIKHGANVIHFPFSSPYFFCF
ncbi:hypothetical protein L5515_017652 [Caenorhabditis briggsae]|uniref:DUF38 domain-containing protein n=1 Tax=Caenorhabditis briggsae TaxID=6238 RepID=A0AAE9FA46_CAEBR|nr:hypothetical protein L5515_017652 [Caenorhabditis briggsae]